MADSLGRESQAVRRKLTLKQPSRLALGLGQRGLGAAATGRSLESRAAGRN
jgi:hypothetical protein